MKIYNYKSDIIIIILFLIIVVGVAKFELDKGHETAPLLNERKELRLLDTYSFEGMVTMVMENYLVIIPLSSKQDNLDSYINRADGICVDTDKEADINYSDFNEGDIVIVKYNGIILESNPAQIIASSIKKE